MSVAGRTGCEERESSTVDLLSEVYQTILADSRDQAQRFVNEFEVRGGGE